MITRLTAIIGTITERMETVPEVTSSAILTGILAVPPVVAVTAGRIARDLTAWTLPETNKPAMIARTETARAANFGRLHGYQKSGVIGFKVYKAAIDDRTSPLCKRLDGQKVKINEKFKDPKGEWSGDVPPAHVNCRSTFFFEMDD